MIFISPELSVPPLPEPLLQQPLVDISVGFGGGFLGYIASIAPLGMKIAIVALGAGAPLVEIGVGLARSNSLAIEVGMFGLAGFAIGFLGGLPSRPHTPAAR